MRWTLALVPLLMLSGCLSTPTDDDEQRTSDPADEPEAENLRKGVNFFEADYEVMPNDVTEIDVTVPEGATAVKVEISLSGPDVPLSEADISLSGCGSGHVTWDPGANVNIVVSISVLEGSWRAAELCGKADAGSHTLTIDGGATPLTGRVLLRADLPADPA